MDKKQQKDTYNDLWAKADAFTDTSPGARWARWLISDILKEQRKTEGAIASIADIGCGDGNKTAALAEFFPNAAVTGFDFAPGGILSAQKRFGHLPNIQFSCDDITDKENWDSTFDLVSAFELLEHIEDWQAMLRDMVNSSNKYILLSFPTGRMRAYEPSIGHLRNFKKGEVEAFLTSLGNVRTVSVYYAGFPVYSPIGRDIMNRNVAFYNEKIMTTSRSPMKALYENIMYFAFRYLSTKKRFGEQFMGLFEKV